jgi:hypothetical protein
MAEPTSTKDLYYGTVGDLWNRPARVRVRGTFSASGATFTPSTTRRQSHPGVTITGASGSYAVAGLPLGGDYHVAGCELAPPTGTQLGCIANILGGSLDTAAGTATLKIRRSDTGAEAAPANGTELFLSLELETGAFV